MIYFICWNWRLVLIWSDSDSLRNQIRNMYVAKSQNIVLWIVSWSLAGPWMISISFSNWNTSRMGYKSARDPCRFTQTLAAELLQGGKDCFRWSVYDPVSSIDAKNRYSKCPISLSSLDRMPPGWCRALFLYSWSSGSILWVRSSWQISEVGIRQSEISLLQWKSSWRCFRRSVGRGPMFPTA
jgi:hypothetical protein